MDLQNKFILISQAFTLYQSADDELATNKNSKGVQSWGIVSRFLDSAKLNTSYVLSDSEEKQTEFFEATQLLRQKLHELRKELFQEISKVIFQSGTQDVESVIKVVKSLISKSLQLLGLKKLPCNFEAVGIGSLGRGEATPYSDIEYLFLIDDLAYRDFFERLKNSGGFITTPGRLLEEYKEVREHPIEEESCKGDITSMLMFTCSIYKHQMQHSDIGLLKEFVNNRTSLMKKKCLKRQQANRNMLKEDLDKFTFHPEYDSYSPGFSMHMKTELCRFPSILLLDLATLMQSVGKDSWTTLSLIGKQYSEHFANHFKKVLGLVCFSRLQCYLAMDSHFDSFRVSASKAPSGSGNMDPLFGFSSENLWEMNLDSFFDLCKDLLTLQLEMKRSEALADCRHDITRQLLTYEIKDDPVADAMAHYFCADWPAVINGLENYYRESLDYHWVRIALAFSYAKFSEHNKARKILEGLRTDLAHRNGKDIDERINVLRLLALCTASIGGFEHDVEDLHNEALKLSKGYDKKELR